MNTIRTVTVRRAINEDERCQNIEDRKKKEDVVFEDKRDNV